MAVVVVGVVGELGFGEWVEIYLKVKMYSMCVGGDWLKSQNVSHPLASPYHNSAPVARINMLAQMVQNILTKIPLFRGRLTLTSNLVKMSKLHYAQFHHQCKYTRENT